MNKNSNWIRALAGAFYKRSDSTLEYLGGTVMSRAWALLTPKACLLRAAMLIYNLKSRKIYKKIISFLTQKARRYL